MKKVLTCLSVVLILGACSSANASYKERFTNGYDGILNISKDTKTGCKYLIYKDEITPLLKADGTPDCGK
jgi:uncharacterized protein YceK